MTARDELVRLIGIYTIDTSQWSPAGLADAILAAGFSKPAWNKDMASAPRDGTPVDCYDAAIKGFYRRLGPCRYVEKFAVLWRTYRRRQNHGAKSGNPGGSHE